MFLSLEIYRIIFEVSDMLEQMYATPCGNIHYWINKDAGHAGTQLVFLPGLAADHRLFDKQIEIGRASCRERVYSGV